MNGRLQVIYSCSSLGFISKSPSQLLSVGSLTMRGIDTQDNAWVTHLHLYCFRIVSCTCLLVVDSICKPELMMTSHSQCILPPDIWFLYRFVCPLSANLWPLRVTLPRWCADHDATPSRLVSVFVWDAMFLTHSCCAEGSSCLQICHFGPTVTQIDSNDFARSHGAHPLISSNYNWTANLSWDSCTIWRPLSMPCSSILC